MGRVGGGVKPYQTKQQFRLCWGEDGVLIMIIKENQKKYIKNENIFKKQSSVFWEMVVDMKSIQIQHQHMMIWESRDARQGCVHLSQLHCIEPSPSLPSKYAFHPDT